MIHILKCLIDVIVILAVLVEFRVVIGNETEIWPNNKIMLGRARRLLIVDTGYERPGLDKLGLVTLKSIDNPDFAEYLNYSTLKAMPTQAISNAINETTGQLVCSFSFNALTHMRLCEFLFGKTDSETTMASIESYADNASTMLGYLLGNKHFQANPLWMTYVYTSNIHRYKQLFSAQQNDGSWLNTFLEIHTDVVRILQIYTSKNCDYRTVYNVNYENSELHAEYSEAKNHPTFQRINDLIRKNMAAISNFHNTYSGIVWFRCQPKAEWFFSPFDDLMVSNFMTKFNVGVDWGTMVSKMDEYYKKSLTDDSPQNMFKYLRNYNDAFITILKVILLRLASKHFLYLKQVNILKRTYTGANYNYFFANKMIMVLSILHMEKETVFQDILFILGSPNWTMITVSQLEQQIDDTSEVVKEHLSPYGGKLEDFILDDDETSTSYDAAFMLGNLLGFNYFLDRGMPIMDTMFTLDVFLRYLTMIQQYKADITIIHSFGLLKMETELMMEYEINTADKLEGVLSDKVNETINESD